jgi:hypothetical protein
MDVSVFKILSKVDIIYYHHYINYMHFLDRGHDKLLKTHILKVKRSKFKLDIPPNNYGIF